MQSTSIENKRHSLAHVLAGAILKLYPDALMTIGPAVDSGFYYDIDFPSNAPKEEDFPRIQDEMKKVLKAWSTFNEEKVTKAEAENIFKNNPYKLELIQGIVDKGEEITLYVSGKGTEYEFTDLCRGGHVEDTKEIAEDSFALDKVAGAYWRGDEKNKMLVRIYGLAYDTKAELDTFIDNREEAKKRDHKKLGKELGLFTFSELVGPGLPLWTPKGTVLRELLNNYVMELRAKYGYQKVSIPHITKKELYQKSGHWDKYKDDLFKIITRENHEYVMKPMNCPHHTQIFDSAMRSYRDMPQRYCETTAVYRDEQSGELSGLSRVLCITQDDAHVFCRVSQIDEEIKNVWNIIFSFYSTFGFADITPRLSRRDPNTPEKYLGDAKNWDIAEDTLKKVIESNTQNMIDGPGEAAFYGPKIDFMAKDALGRNHQVATIQLDFVMPKRFELSCVNEKGEKEDVVMLHVAIMGSIERFLSVMIENFAGAFPLWLSPVQLKVIPIGERQMDFAHDLFKKIVSEDIRVEIDQSNESLGKKVRASKLEKVPYLIVVGDKEMESNTFSLEGRNDEKVTGLPYDEMIKFLKEKIESKSL